MEPADLHEILRHYSAQLPRYTSYPTAAHFGSIGAGDYQQWLENIPAGASTSLYLHVPFCQKLCWFCGCHTRITQRYAPLLPYMDALLAEMALIQAHTNRPKVDHIHFGGGSPSMLTPEDFTRLMDGLHAHFAITDDAEVAIEIDPRGLNEAKVAAYAKAGVNRISLGVQDFDPDVQKAINRIQPFSMVYEAVQMLRYYGIQDINLDFIYGLPKQRVDTMLHTIDLALLLNPSRIAFYGYAHVPHKKKNITLIEEDHIPETFERLTIYKRSAEKFIAEGYQPVGLDHFIRPDDGMAKAHRARCLTRNFQGYSTDQAPYLIGLGASAIGNMPQGFAQNTASIEDYRAAISAGKFATQRGMMLDDEDRLRGAIIHDLMCYLECNLAERCAEYGADMSLFDDAFAYLRPLIDREAVTYHEGHIAIRPDAPQLARIACAAFDRHLHQSERGFAHVA